MTALREEGSPSLEDLDLSGSHADVIGEVELQPVADTFSAGSFSRLTRLKIDRWQGGVGCGCKVFFRAIADGHTPLLQSLEAHLDDLEEETFDEAVEIAAEAVREKKVPQIETLCLDLESLVSPGSLSALARALGSGGASSLKRLELDWSSPSNGPGGVLLDLAGALGGGGMPYLESLKLDPGFGVEEGEGASAIGEILSTGKARSLRCVEIHCPANGTLRAFCEGLCVGSTPNPEMKLDLHVWDLPAEAPASVQAGIAGLERAIRTGKLSYLRNMGSPIYHPLPHTAADPLGRALTHAGAKMVSLETISLQFAPQPPPQNEGPSQFLKALSEGRGCLPSLEALELGYPSPRLLGGEAMRQLCAVVRAGKVPRLKRVAVFISGAEDLEEDRRTQALTATLFSSYAASSREVFVGFPPAQPTVVDVRVGIFSASLTSDHLSKLSELHVSGVSGRLGVRSLCAGIGSGKLSSLRVLILQMVRLEDAESQSALSDSVDAEKLPFLRVLRLSSASLPDDGLKALTSAWMSRPPCPLQTLDLSGNHLSSEGAGTLSTFLGSRRMPALSSIILTGNLIDEMWKTLFEDAFPQIVEW
uniref:Uncharacterized protein n=1 Tax=Chromera velia CCMP2878 TaxID=1169474 RepID=A0A0G4FPB6_9ALVE|eukprot:Cvel_18039.t1-p1 / transcript=Cvel_18039.t1 / gene=Cvel_18039 / organism=Chromera_velia_CCMP2878 / gene_product=hypothetical protein / transcript_product=hypothetical protein / location=Cvel_scaffold1473:17420-19186(+) / protein_length=589 / sequence_SO=supercontig / SO=protein_coding / is_pseudo=false